MIFPLLNLLEVPDVILKVREVGVMGDTLESICHNVMNNEKSSDPYGYPAMI